MITVLTASAVICAAVVAALWLLIKITSPTCHHCGGTLWSYNKCVPVETGLEYTWNCCGQEYKEIVPWEDLH